MPPFRKKKSKRKNPKSMFEETHKPIRALVGEQPSNSVNEPDNVPFLPFDIILDILKRLRVKSLARFQCVCKDWRNLIKSPAFTQDQSSHQSPSLLLKWHRSRSFQMQVGLLDRDMQVHEVQSSPLFNWSFARIVGSSNGLLCVEIYVNERYPFPLLLWNPAIREFRKVRRRSVVNFEFDDLLGFGFSQVDNDYKIVRIKVPHYRFMANPMEVYSLNSGSWKEVEFGNLEGVTIRDSGNVTVNGVMFWIGGKQCVDNDYGLILSFDLSKEVWTVIPMPDLNYYNKIRLTEYENKLAVLAGIFGEHKSYLVHLWVMEEDAWTKVFTSSSCPRVLDPMTILRNEIVFCPVNQFEDGAPTPILYLLNITSNEFQRFAIKSYSYHRIDIEVFIYVESLVSVAGVSIEEI